MTVYPLDTMTVTSPFGPRKPPAPGSSATHLGVDLRAPVGTPVHAIKAGSITAVTRNSARGIYVVVNHGGGVSTLCQHLSTATVHVGEGVHEGAVIARTGATGNVSGPHLHFEVQLNGTPTNPMPWLTAHLNDATAGQVLKLGSEGPVVRALQRGLLRMFPAYADAVAVQHGAPLADDGRFGPQTDAWVREFQERVGITSDGSVGPITTAKLAGYGILL